MSKEVGGEKKTICVVGGGAAGYFAAITAAERGHGVVIKEKSQKTLAKVRISGGGRCNVTHDCLEVRDLIKNYPRGGKKLGHCFEKFAVKDTIAWFESRGVPLKVEEDGRMFPTSDNSESIAQCLEDAAHLAGVRVELGQDVQSVQVRESGKIVTQVRNGRQEEWDAVVLAAGGLPKLEHWKWIRDISEIEIVPPQPSLFSLNVHSAELQMLMGTSVARGEVGLAGSKRGYKGPILVTHWGLSGPAVLKMSAFEARTMAEMGYGTDIWVRWDDADNFETVGVRIEALQQEHAKKRIATVPYTGLTRRLWEYLLEQISEKLLEATWEQLGSKQKEQLKELIWKQVLHVQGKTTYKEEFVTAGGISLAEIDWQRMELKKARGVYACGEVLDVDGVTGGFNFQAAWSTGFVAGSSV